MKRKERINLRHPPANQDLTELFQFIWDHGLGNEFDRSNAPVPWTEKSMQNAFDLLDQNLDTRTIQNWLSGKNIPTRKNLYLLSRISSGDDEDLKREWSDALLEARRKTKKSRQVPLPPRLPAPTLTDVETRTSSLRRFILLSVGLIVPILVAWMIFKSDTTDKVQKNPMEMNAKSIAVLPFSDLSAEQDQVYFSDGISEDIINGLAQIPELSVRSRTASFAFRETNYSVPQIRERLGVSYFLEGAIRKTDDAFRLTARLIETEKGGLIWSKSYSGVPSDIFETQENIAAEITRALDIYLDPEKRSGMFSFGTRDVKAYEHYKRGRYILKHWHETSKGDEIWKADKEFKSAIKADPSFAKAYFHNVDIYYHLGKGDISGLDDPESRSSLEIQQMAMTKIDSLLDEAITHAATPADKAQYKVNQIFFSDDWTGLREAAVKFGTLAAKGKGELEWEFGPVALVLLGELDVLHDLVNERILAYDPLNGTGHSYSVRAELVAGDFKKAHERLESSTAKTFSHRLDEVKGYLLFAEGNESALTAHLETAENMTEVMREYFRVLLIGMDEETKLAAEELKLSEALYEDPIQSALALIHTGNLSQGEQLLTSEIAKPLGVTLYSVAIAYGAACGPKIVPANIEVERRFREAEISLSCSPSK